MKQGKDIYKDPPVLPPKVEVLLETKSEPIRDPETKVLIFPDFDEFRPNMTPEEVLKEGSFGGTYFRDIESAVTNKKYKGEDVISEFPKSWFKGLKKKHWGCPEYQQEVNKYKVKCGGSLGMWESSGWITAIDPYGWFQWYCRFYLGRRSTDDQRQIDRWEKATGERGRFRNQLFNKIISQNTEFDDFTVSPVIRQVLQHWAFTVTQESLDAYKDSKVIPASSKSNSKKSKSGTKGKK